MYKKDLIYIYEYINRSLLKSTVMEKSLPNWILVLMSLGVMFLFEIPIVRPLEISIAPVDDTTPFSFTELPMVLSSGRLAR